MRIILDGYNVIRQWPELAMLDRGDLQAGRDGLLRELQAYRRVRGHQITVVFDGREQGGFSETAESVAGITVRYSKRGETADAVIARLAADSGEGAVVVSSDRELAATARRYGAVTLTAAEFVARLEAGRIATLKGGEEDARPAKPGKGTARRLPKAERRRQQRLRAL
jgi:predicted RNA-binding protein with PIN domain